MDVSAIFQWAIGIMAAVIMIQMGVTNVHNDRETVEVAKVVAMLLIALAILSGCAPYLEAGAGYSFATGDYGPIEETGSTAHAAIGVEFEDRWYTPSYCEFRHRSMINEHPEIVTEDVTCAKRIYFGERP